MQWNCESQLHFVLSEFNSNLRSIIVCCTGSKSDLRSRLGLGIGKYWLWLKGESPGSECRSEVSVCVFVF